MQCMVSHPSAQNAEGWGTELLVDPRDQIEITQFNRQKAAFKTEANPTQTK
jgi:hypothetical protein